LSTEHPHSTSVLCVSLRGRVQVPKHRVALIGTLIGGGDSIQIARVDEGGDTGMKE
jgi:hypothetical protein